MRLDQRKVNFDFEVGVYPPDEAIEKSGSHGNTRLPYGLCKAAGIDTEGMTPSDAWAALAGETGIEAEYAYKKLETEGNAKKLAKEVKEGKKAEHEKAEAHKFEPEGDISGTEEFEEAPIVFSEKEEKPEPLTVSEFNKEIKKLRNESKDEDDFEDKVKKQIIPRIAVGMTVSASGREYLCVGDGFVTAKGEERTPGFVAHRIAQHGFGSGSITLSDGSDASAAKNKKDSTLKFEAEKTFEYAMKNVPAHGGESGKALTSDIIDNLPIGTNITFPLYGDTAVAEKVADDRYYIEKTGEKLSQKDFAERLVENLDKSNLPKIDAADFALPYETKAGIPGYTWKPHKPKKEPSKGKHSEPSAYTKSGLKSGGPIKVKKSPGKVFVSRLKSLVKFDFTRSIWAAMHRKMFREKEIPQIESEVKRILDENEYCMCIKSKKLDRIFKDGFANQIQTFESPDMGYSKKEGYKSPEERRVASLHLFGTDMGAKGAEYEKYGFVGNPWKSDENYASGYGDVTVVFDKKKIGSRTTYTFGDSLGPAHNKKMVAGRAGKTPTFEGWFLNNPEAKVTQALKDGESLKNLLKLAKLPYMELQFHGPLTISDVKELVFSDSYAYQNAVTKEMQDALDELGVKVSFRY